MKGLPRLPLGVFTAVFIVQGYALCQSPNPLTFFPHHQGDIWEYYDPYYPGYEQNRITHDSLSPDGRYWIEMTRIGVLMIDTSASTVYQVGGFGRIFDLFPKFRLDADSGDVWVVFQDSVYRNSARVVDTYDTYLFSPELVAVKEIDYFDYSLGSPESLLTDTYYLASGYGIIARDVDTFPVWRLRGCIIGGILHGAVTNVATAPNPSPSRVIQLFQNYPNPFNSSTTVEYYLDRDGEIQLELFDLLGRRITVLESAYHSRGPGRVTIDGQGLPSGMYLYRLRSQNQSLSRRLLLIR